MLHGRALEEKIKERKEERDAMVRKVGEMMKDGLGFSEIAKRLNEPESRIRSWASDVDITGMDK